MNCKHALKKIIRYIAMYCVQRTLVKIVGRSRYHVPFIWMLAPLKSKSIKIKDIGIIGCGQFAFSTIGFFIIKKYGNRIGYCFDINKQAAQSLAICYQVDKFDWNYIEEKNLDQIKLVYIASNHASHTDYAIYFLQRNIDVYLEKPISVSQKQLQVLINSAQNSTAKLYFGYNRPYSKAIQELKLYIRPQPFTLNCIVIGHFIPTDHWYRHPAEGTRICGNLGHWLDLTYYLTGLSGGVLYFDITIGYADVNNADDNLTVVLTSNRNDIITITLTSRSEPFAGINETIIFQQENLLMKIDDFRRAEFHLGEKKITKRYWPKDAGHKQAILMPFNLDKKMQRESTDVFESAALILQVMDLVKQKNNHARFHANGSKP